MFVWRTTFESGDVYAHPGLVKGDHDSEGVLHDDEAAGCAGDPDGCVVVDGGVFGAKEGENFAAAREAISGEAQHDGVVELHGVAEQRERCIDCGVEPVDGEDEPARDGLRRSRG